MERTLKITVMVSNEERDMLRRLAKARGLSMSDWVRMRAREAWEAWEPNDACQAMIDEARGGPRAE